MCNIAIAVCPAHCSVCAYKTGSQTVVECSACTQPTKYNVKATGKICVANIAHCTVGKPADSAKCNAITSCSPGFISTDVCGKYQYIYIYSVIINTVNKHSVYSQIFQNTLIFFLKGHLCLPWTKILYASLELHLCITYLVNDGVPTL